LGHCVHRMTMACRCPLMDCALARHILRACDSGTHQLQKVCTLVRRLPMNPAAVEKH